MGALAYTRAASVEGLPFKTLFLDGRLNFGVDGAFAYGLVFAIVGVIFVVAAVAILAGWPWWVPPPVVASAASLLLTGVDWSFGFRGAIIDAIILAALVIAPRRGWMILP